jgi:hypothetical protein
MRGWIKDVASYIEPVQIGVVMRATGLGMVLIEAEDDTGLDKGGCICSVCIHRSFLQLDINVHWWKVIEPVQIGTVMQAAGLGTVIKAGDGCKLRLRVY